MARKVFEIDKLPRREREILEVVCSLKEASAADVRRHMPADPLSDSATRALLARLEVKNLVRHRAEERRYIYFPTPRARGAAASALRNLVRAFFSNSPVRAATALLGLTENLTAQEVKELEQALKKAKERTK